MNQYNGHAPVVPLGGFKQSGFGRELGKDAIGYYTESKTIFVGK
ncbi:MAG TPA: aldehyde dehydrogenase family protein [Thermoanaerobaculia bacterium]|nr:aldehyde dehydrogenase family protein [Thermoanaerobaculia bacterium]